MATEPAPWGLPVDLSSDEFFGMIEAGLFARERRVFLWCGRVFEKAAKTPTQALTAAARRTAFEEFAAVSLKGSERLVPPPLRGRVT